jgi:hypothetical protein
MIYNTKRELYLYRLMEVDCLTKNNQGKPFQNEVSPKAGLCANGSSAEIEAIDVISISSPSFIIPEFDQEESDSKIFKEGVRHLKHRLATHNPFLLDFQLTTTKCYKDRKTNALTGYDISHTCINDEVINGILSKNKKYLPKFYTNTSQNHSCAIADFDILPKSYQSWEAFRNRLGMYFTDSAIVTTSATGKAKVFFFFDGKLTLEQKKIYLKHNFSFFFGDNLWTMKAEVDGKHKDVLDKAGIEASFITWGMLNELQNKIHSTKIHKFSFSPDPIVLHKKSLKIMAVQKTPKWNLFKGQVPENIQDMSKYVRYVFPAIAGNLKYATTLGMSFPLKFHSEVSGYNVRYLSGALKALVKLGVIVKNSNYKVGHHANSYKFTGFYLQWAKNELEKIRTVKSGKSLEQIMDSIEDGNWNLPLFDLAIYSIRHHWSRETYLETVKGIPGWNEKPERIKQATSAYTSYSKWINRAAYIKLKVA